MHSVFFCFTDYYRTGQSLAYEKIESILTQGARMGLRFLRLSGGGEPLLHPRIGEVLERCQQLNLRNVDLTTNGILLGQFVEPLLATGADLVFVSLNEPTPELYAQTMQIKAKMFERVIDSIQRMCAARDAAPAGARPTVALQFMVAGHNWRLMEQMYRLGIELGVDWIDIKGMMGATGERKIPASARDEIRGLIRGLIETDFSRARQRLRFAFLSDLDLNHFAAEELKRATQERQGSEPLTALPSSGKNPLRSEYCLMAWYGSTITATGHVYPCCPLHELPEKRLGDLNAQTLEQIWHGERYRHFRRAMRRIMLLRGEMEYSPKCMSCMDSSCIARQGCYFTFNLASADFYQRLAQRMEREVSFAERTTAQLGNKLIAGVHQARQFTRNHWPLNHPAVIAADEK